MTEASHRTPPRLAQHAGGARRKAGRAVGLTGWCQVGVARAGNDSGLYFDYTFYLQIEIFQERARQDSNLRRYLFVVILLHRQGETVGDRERQNNAFIKS